MLIGIKVAAETYFNKQADSLNIQESAVFVGMLQSVTFLIHIAILKIPCESEMKYSISFINTIIFQARKHLIQSKLLPIN